MNGEHFILIKTVFIGLCGAILGLFNEPIFDVILTLSIFNNITEYAEMYSKIGGAVAVTLTCIYLVQKILGKRK